MTEYLSFVVSAEIDSVKSGKPPKFKQNKGSNKFIRYKDLVVNNNKEYFEIKTDSNSPNLYFLQKNAKDLVKLVKKEKELDNYINFIRYDFELNESWESSLNMNIVSSLQPILIAYHDFLPTLNYRNKNDTENESSVMILLKDIILLQYDETIMKSKVIDNLIVKLTKLGTPKLTDSKSRIVDEQWHFMQDNKMMFLNNLIPDFFRHAEIELLMNFHHSGHKLLYLVLTEAISICNNLEKEKLFNISTISRNLTLIEKTVYSSNKNSDFNQSAVLKFIWESDNLPKIFNYLSKDFRNLNTLERNNVKSKIKSIVTKIRRLKRTLLINDNAVINDSNLYYRALSATLIDENGIERQAIDTKELVYNYLNKELKVIFDRNQENIQSIIKYLHFMKNMDPGMRFLFNICRNYITKEVYNNDK